MKIVIISDIHANLAALEALPERGCDGLWCLGDLVDYGPKPREVIRWIMRHASIIVRGNHDHVDPQCSPAYKHLASVTMDYTRSICNSDDIEFLKWLPVQRQIHAGGAMFDLVHAAPTDPLFGYRAKDSQLWDKEIECIDSDFLLVGHTHTPFIRKIGSCTIVNPGSLGQPKTGRPLACYALWEDGTVTLKEYMYPVHETSRQIGELPLAEEDAGELVAILETGGSAMLDVPS